MSKYFFIFILSFFIYSCTSSPRYRTGPQKPSISKNKTPVSLKTKSNIDRFVASMSKAKGFARDLGLDGDEIIKDMMSSDYEHAVKVFDDNFGDFVTLLR